MQSVKLVIVRLQMQSVKLVLSETAEVTSKACYQLDDRCNL